MRRTWMDILALLAAFLLQRLSEAKHYAGAGAFGVDSAEPSFLEQLSRDVQARNPSLGFRSEAFPRQVGRRPEERRSGEGRRSEVRGTDASRRGPERRGQDNERRRDRWGPWHEAPVQPSAGLQIPDTNAFPTIQTKARLMHDNLVMDEPKIMCLEKTVGLAVNTRDPFFGRIFVNGLSNMPECTRHFNSPHATGQFEIPLGSCNMRMQRIVYPRPGLEFNTMMMVSFHSDLLTETDRVFHVKCQYYETQRSIGSFFEVSMLPTQIITSSFPVPQCKYTLHIQTVNGPTAQFARIGEKVFHRWQCDSDMYGIKVKSCFVDDGRKRRYQLIDATGCAQDLSILPDVTYDPSLRSAFVQTHVFKFADRAHVFFQCELSLCLKERGACDGVTPPNCARIRNKRALPAPEDGYEDEEDVDDAEDAKLDLASHSLLVLDPGDEERFDAYVAELRKEGDCAPSLAVAGLVAANLVSLAVGTVTSLLLCRRSGPPKLPPPSYAP